MRQHYAISVSVLRVKLDQNPSLSLSISGTAGQVFLNVCFARFSVFDGMKIGTTVFWPCYEVS